MLAAAILPSPVGPAAAHPRGTLVASARFVPAAGPVLTGDGGIAWVSRDGAT